MSRHHLLFKNIHENRVSCRSKCCMQFLWLYSIFLFYVLWPLSQIFEVTKYFRLIAIMNLVYIIVFTSHIFNFWRGSKSANGGPYLLVDLDPRGSISTSRFGPGAPNLLVDMDRGHRGFTLHDAVCCVAYETYCWCRNSSSFTLWLNLKCNYFN
jgi:hypothetical protein